MAEDCTDDACMEGPSIPTNSKQEASEFLLSVDNDSWQSDEIIHWCKLGCCTSSKESKLKLWVSLQDSC